MSIIKGVLFCVVLAAAQIVFAAGHPGDFDHNHIVDFDDFFAFVNVFGTSSSDPGYDARMDFNNDNTVDFDDFFAFVDVFGTSGSPDLVVESPSVSSDSLTTGQAFTLTAVVLNLGNAPSAAVTVRFYRSTDAEISTSDTLVGSRPLGELAASEGNEPSISLNAPSTAGTYFYGACADGVSGEPEIDNNCSTGVPLTIVPPPAADFESLSQAAFARFNEQREQMGLGALKLAVEGDDSFIPVERVVVGCHEDVGMHEFLMAPDIHGIGFFPWTQGTECGLEVATYHIVPLDQRMRVESTVWDCFTDSRDLRDANDVSCSGRYSFIERHVRWLPDQVAYAIVEGEEHRDRVTALVPWVREKLNVELSEASADKASISLYLGVERPQPCPNRYGCNTWDEVEGEVSAAIFIAAPDEFFSQTLKHELLHVLLPMGHLPPGNFLMSVSPEDPSKTHTLSALEEKLLRLYTHPYLRDEMRMDEFRRYLVIEE